MPNRAHAPIGSPCWTDLWTSDVDGSRAFYSELFGWEALAPSPEFGGYFMFARDGVPVAGGMGDMGADMPANNTWRIYLTTNDMSKTIERAGAEGAQVVVPAIVVADLGTQAAFIDSTGASVGAWQPGTFAGFTVLGEHGAPSWFELLTGDYAGAVDFYRAVFGWDTNVVAASDEFGYTVMLDPDGGEDLAGIMDAAAFLTGAAFWSTYWHVDDTDAALTKVVALGGSVVDEATETPYGRLASVADPAGARFKLRTPNQVGT